MAFLDTFRRSRRVRRSAAALAVAAMLPAYASAQTAPTAPTSLTLPELTAAPPAACMVLKGAQATKQLNLSQTFYDDFSKLDVSVLGGNGKTWLGYYPYGSPTSLGDHTLTGNNEKEIYVYPAYAGSGTTPLNLNPFSYVNGALNITATQTTAAQQAVLYKYPYYSGLLQSRNLFSQTYGYFEINAQMPRGYSMWPAFWLLPENNTWPPEIDVLEMFGGGQPITMTTHWKSATTNNAMSYCAIPAGTAESAFHLYGVLWTPTQITYYLDRQPVITLATPPSINMPMFMLLNLAVQSNVLLTGPTAGPKTATYYVKWVSVYSANTY